MYNYRTGLILAVVLALSGCASPNIAIKPTLPTPTTSPSLGPGADVRVDVLAGSSAPRFEEKTDKTLLGRSESLGVQLSDFWMEEPPVSFVQRLVETNLRAWGNNIVPNGEKVQVRGEVNRFSLNSKAISALEFQADGLIDVVLDVVPKPAGRTYRQQYIATCSFRTATSIPNAENMQRLFDQCVDELQKRISADGALRAAVTGQSR